MGKRLASGRMAITLYFDITDLINEDGKDNTLACVGEFCEQSRWYPGAGLYRNVHVITTNAAHIPMGTYVTTPEVNEVRG